MILDGKQLRDEIFSELKGKICDLNLSLAVIQIGSDEASNIYIKQKENMCNKLNINFKHYHFDEQDTTEDVLDLIEILNNNDTTGILLQLPIPEHFNKIKLQNAINYKKDVDGLNKENVFRLINNEEGIRPCTALGVVTLLDKYNLLFDGCNITVVGRSNLVGKPLANMLLNRNATVTLCHTKTKNLKDITRNANIIVSATGCPKLIKEDMVNANSIIIDIGITKVNNRICGDTDFDNIKDKVKAITPVPGGIGPMTIACLAQNIYNAYLLQKKS